MTPPEIMQLAKEAGISVGYPIRPDRDPLFVIASLIEARVREKAAGKCELLPDDEGCGCPCCLTARQVAMFDCAAAIRNP